MGVLKYSIDDMRRLAKRRGGQCLSDRYQSSSSKLAWKCQQGHTWRAIPFTVIRGTWCPKCAVKEHAGKSQRLIIDWFKAYARKMGGVCLSDSYQNARSILIFRCRSGHRWKTTGRNIRRGSWCPVCGGSAPLSIDIFQKIARERGGQCLTKSYHNTRQYLVFVCESGHRFEKPANAIRSTAQWCPECSQNMGERICKVAFETIFGDTFNPQWPEWLRNSRGEPMEFDGYSKSLNIAFEHQGEQHYSTNTHWITTKDELLRRKKDDRRKYYLARKHGVVLFRVPQVPQRIKPERLIGFIVRKAKQKGLRLPKDWKDLGLDWKRIYHSHGRERINYCKGLAKNRGGRFLSTQWIGEEGRYSWRCSEGHEWQTKVRYIVRGSWCKYCSRVAKHSISEFIEYAKSKDGLCLSTKYISAHKPLQFRCGEGHIFTSSGSNVLNLGRWCPECAGKKKLTLKQMQDIAMERGGKCLSSRYMNVKSKLMWSCKRGHRWQATPSKIKMGRWCPICRGR